MKTSEEQTKLLKNGIKALSNQNRVLINQNNAYANENEQLRVQLKEAQEAVCLLQNQIMDSKIKEHEN